MTDSEREKAESALQKLGEEFLAGFAEADSDCPACGNPILDCTCHDEEDVCEWCGEYLSDCDCDDEEM